MMEQAKKLEAEFIKLRSKHLPDDINYSRLEKIPSDADSSEESEESTRGNNSESEESTRGNNSETEQEEELDQSLSTVVDENDKDWTGDSTPDY